MSEFILQIESALAYDEIDGNMGSYPRNELEIESRVQESSYQVVATLAVSYVPFAPHSRSLDVSEQHWPCSADYGCPIPTLTPIRFLMISRRFLIDLELAGQLYQDRWEQIHTVGQDVKDVFDVACIVRKLALASFFRIYL